MGKENNRMNINIAEEEDTFHNEEEFAKIFNRGENLRKQMNQVLEKDKAWETIHGVHEVPKKYVPPFLQESQNESDDLDNIYAYELDGEESGKPSGRGKEEAKEMVPPQI